MSQQNRDSTSKTYLRIWRQFNKFVINLDVKPASWEERLMLYVTYMVDTGMQSATIKTYISAIKRVLSDDGYKLNSNQAALHALTRTCKLVNDKVKTRLPITCGLLELNPFELQRYFVNTSQWYLNTMYKALFTLGYYGLMRVGELTWSDHVIKACNVHVARNKDKILLMLYTSKTHSVGNRPQKIRITSNQTERSGNYLHRNFCPVKAIQDYLEARGEFVSAAEPLFLFRDGSPVTPVHARSTLKWAINEVGLNTDLYGIHSLRIGRTSDLAKYNYSIKEIRRMGRWRSNVVYKYIRQ